MGRFNPPLESDIPGTRGQGFGRVSLIHLHGIPLDPLVPMNEAVPKHVYDGLGLFQEE